MQVRTASVMGHTKHGTKRGLGPPNTSLLRRPTFDEPVYPPTNASFQQFIPTWKSCVMNVDNLYDPQFVPGEDEMRAYADFIAVVRQLRRDCPWDREQTHESVKHLLIEEAYETVSAIDEENWDDLKKELGDLFLHVVFHSVIAEQDGRF